MWCPKKDTIRRQCRRQRIKDRRIKTLICEQTIRFSITGGKINEQKRRKHLQKKRRTMGSQIYQRASLSAERARYDALIADHQKSCDAMIRKYKELAERGTTGQDTNV